MRLRITKAGVLAGAAVLFTAGAVITGIWGGRYVDERIERVREEKEEKEEEVTTVDIVKAAAPVVAPSIVFGAVAMVCTILSHRSSLKYEAGLLGLLGASTTELKKHKHEIERAIGKATEKGKVTQPVVQLNRLCTTQEDADEWPVPESDLIIPREDDIFDTGRGNDLVYDGYSNRWFRTSLLDVMECRYHLNRNFHLGMPTTYNTWCEWLGIEGVPYGEDNGWPMDYMIVNESPWIDIYGPKMKLRNGTEFTNLVYFLDPVPMESDYI